MAEIETKVMPIVGQEAKKLNHSYIASNNVKWYKRSISFKKKKSKRVTTI